MGWGREGVCLQSHEGDVSTCHIVVITCAAVAARLVVIAVVRRSGARNLCGGRECRSCKREEDEREWKKMKLKFALISGWRRQANRKSHLFSGCVD